MGAPDLCSLAHAGEGAREESCQSGELSREATAERNACTITRL